MTLIDNNALYRSEVFDMLHSRDDDEKHVDLPIFPEDAEDARAEVPAVPDAQAEFLQGKHDSFNLTLCSSFITWKHVCDLSTFVSWTL